MTEHEDKKLLFEEHFILRNIKLYIWKYLLLWAIALILSVAMTLTVNIELDYTTTRIFSVTIFSLSITTITFAIPTCMRTIFSAYEGYYSTKIKEILIQRFPITLLALSAFTSLFTAMSVASGFIGGYIPVPLMFVFTLISFWGIVCIVYVFIAIEKLVHFVVKAPEAVLDKLEFGVFEASDLSSPEEYDEFRQKLASMNDIAATIVSKSTGRDVIIVRCLNALRDIHRTYLRGAIGCEDETCRRRHFKACRAVSQEMIRIYREAVSSKNEHAAKSVLVTYCNMISDAVSIGADSRYITEMLAQVERFQSYAMPSNIEVIQEQATADWFFYLAKSMQENNIDAQYDYTKVCIVRQLSASLKRITVDNRENLMFRFMRVASNSDMEINLEEYDEKWLSLIDRAIIIYLTWLYKSEPKNVEIYLRYLATYSASYNQRMRSVLCDSTNRLKQVFVYDHIAQNITEKQKKLKKNTIGDDGSYPFMAYGTSTIMGLSPDMDIYKAMAYGTVFSYVNADKEKIKSMDVIAEKTYELLDQAHIDNAESAAVYDGQPAYPSPTNLSLMEYAIA